MKHVFYIRELEENFPEPEALPPNYRVEIWRPSLGSIKPRGMPPIRFGLLWIFHFLRIFHNRDYSLVLIYEGDRLLHHTCVLPGYFRVPFMGKSDLQIGRTWTDESQRGKGLAAWAIRKTFAVFGRPGRRFWYIASEENAPSIRVAVKCGFSLLGGGHRLPRFGSNTLGVFVPDTLPPERRER